MYGGVPTNIIELLQYAIKQQGSRAYRELVRAEKLYLKAIENYRKGVTHTWNREESNENVTLSNQGVESDGEVRYNKKSYYSQFNTLALSWASRAPAGELKGFYDTRTYKIVEATGDDAVYVVIKTIPSSNEALVEYYEEYINENNQSINRNAEDICRIIDKLANGQGQHNSNSSNATRGQANEGVRSLGEGKLASNGERASTQSSGDKSGIKPSLKDSQGRTLTEAQAKFFADSKVRDEQGNLLVVYHGTLAKELYKFNKDFIGSRFSFDDRGFFFIDRKSIADDYATSDFGHEKGSVIPCYIFGKKPLVINSNYLKKNGYPRRALIDDDCIGFWDSFQGAILDDFDEADADCIIIDDGMSRMVVAFEPNQIKSITNENPTKNEDIRYSLKSFAEQVDDVLNGADTSSTHLRIMDTPTLLQEAGLPNLPILMTAKHLKTITSAGGKDNSNYHNLSVDIVKNLPSYISEPVVIADSLTRGDSVVIITEAIDSENRPVIAAILLNGKGRLDTKHISANIMTSAYGKDNFQLFLNRLVQENAIIYWDKKKSQTLSVSLGVQFPNAITNLDSNSIIRKARAFVNTQDKNTKYSLKSDSRLSEGEFRKIIANLKFEKKYSLNDAKDIVRHLVKKISHDSYFAEFKTKDLDELSHILWKGLNSEQEGYRVVVECRQT